MRKRRSAGWRCVADGCERLVRPGRALCPDHERGAYGGEVEAAVGRLARRVSAEFTASASRPFGKGDDESDRERQRRAAVDFGRRLERGDDGGLFEGRLRAVLAQAATERGLAEEIGALRVTLARLLTTEGEDPLRVAHAVARVAGVTVRAVGAQRALEGATGGELAAALMQTLAELDAERAVGEAGQAGSAKALPPGGAAWEEHG